MAMDRRIALKIAYDGCQFAGFSRQPGKKTVEGSIFAALREIRAIRDPRSAKYRCASRTDAGVSAFGNVISIDTSFPAEKLQRALNSRLEDIWCTGIAILPEGFDVRHGAISREYWYFMAKDNLNVERMQSCTELFLGEHDFSRYGRMDGRNPIRKILSFDISETGRLILLRVKGESFLWNQVRRMAWAIEQVGKGCAEPDEISPEDYRLRRIGVAPAENLILADVDIGFEFESNERNSKTLRDAMSKLVRLNVRTELLGRIIRDLSNGQIV